MILHIARVILIVFEVLALFNLLIIVHELGHFLAARWRGLYIEKFGIWFGKPIWKKTINEVEYSLGSLPFGGFVALPQLAPMDIIEGKAVRFLVSCSRWFLRFSSGWWDDQSANRKRPRLSAMWCPLRPPPKLVLSQATRFFRSMDTRSLVSVA